MQSACSNKNKGWDIVNKYLSLCLFVSLLKVRMLLFKNARQLGCANAPRLSAASIIHQIESRFSLRTLFLNIINIGCFAMNKGVIEHEFH